MDTTHHVIAYADDRSASRYDLGDANCWESEAEAQSAIGALRRLPEWEDVPLVVEECPGDDRATCYGGPSDHADNCACSRGVHSAAVPEGARQ